MYVNLQEGAIQPTYFMFWTIYFLSWKLQKYWWNSQWMSIYYVCLGSNNTKWFTVNNNVLFNIFFCPGYLKKLSRRYCYNASGKKLSWYNKKKPACSAPIS